MLQPRGKSAFLRTLADGSRLLDAGCGNDSPRNTKAERPDIFYIGLDIGDYRQQRPPREYADRYILASAEQFPAEIEKLRGTLDAVISAHNLEHCLEPQRVLSAMLTALKPRGRLFLAFPCEASVHFPSRDTSLNFHDDATHRYLVPYIQTLEHIRSAGFDVEFATPRYRPMVPFLIGLLLEPVGLLLRKNMPLRSTWALYGFESVIWATRRAPASQA